MIEKTIKVEFNAQSKAVVEKVSITYHGDLTELQSLGVDNDSILKETIDLQTKAASHSRSQSMYK